MANNPFDLALRNYMNGKKDVPLMVHNDYGSSEEMPLWYLFRELDDMPPLEKLAMDVCEGNILDVGAGCGVHAMTLQQSGHLVTAIDTSQMAVNIMKQRGLEGVQRMNFFDLRLKKFDTILLLMNGIGIIGKLERLEIFLMHAKSLLNPGGQLIFDSSDIKYLYEDDKLPSDKYYGEVRFQFEYQNIKGEWFDWVYIDPDTLFEVADACGWFVYFLYTDENDQYLVRMIPK